MPVFQNNDIDIEIFLEEKDGTSIPPGTVSAAEYRLYNLAKTELLVSKSLGAGIVSQGDALVIEITEDECQALRGVFYHEMKVTTAGKSWTALSENIRLKPTEI